MKALIFISLILGSCSASINNSEFELINSEFENPPSSARPYVWWHWMNGNISKEGIKKDLEWMHRVGIGGIQNFDANLNTPVVVAEQLTYMTPKWKEAFAYAAELAVEYNLELAVAGSPGWSVTGGPWVAPSDGMKKYVWSELRVEGGKKLDIELPHPPTVTGSFSNVVLVVESDTNQKSNTDKDYYNDALVIAYKLPENVLDFSKMQPKVTSSGGSFGFKQLTDGDDNTTEFLPPKKAGEQIYTQYEFNEPQTFKAASIVGAHHVFFEQFFGGPENRTLKVSDDGINFKDVASVPGSINPQNTITFQETTAKFWRLSYTTILESINPYIPKEYLKESQPMGVNVAEFKLYREERISQFEDKSGFTAWKENDFPLSEKVSFNQADVIDEDFVLDVSKYMNKDGRLQWVAPKGKWMILRFGYSLTGRLNHPASPEGTGLEVDKLDSIAVKNYINYYLDLYKDATKGKMGGEGLQSLILDSYEAGHMTWTKNMTTEFKKRRGYDIQKWLPVLTGAIVKDPISSENFLWDFRKTIGEMIVDNHYGVIKQELEKRGMKLYAESHENGRVYLADGMDVKRKSDIPMGAMWAPKSGGKEEARSEGDIRESASVANLYGKPLVAAESMTASFDPFAFDPYRLKRTADMELASGLNRFVIHTSVHQPFSDDHKPGVTLATIGQNFTRNETWAEQAHVWTDYLARSSYLMQQGSNVADILYYVGENRNITELTQNGLPKLPKGYEFDFVNATALLEAVKPVNGKLVGGNGNQYAVLILGSTAKIMTLTVLKRILALAESGVKISGTRPIASPSLVDDPEEFKIVSEMLWQHPNVCKDSLTSLLQSVRIRPDVEVNGTLNEILFRHRTIKKGMEIYWLNNRSDSATDAKINFRVTGKIPQLWDPETGEKRAVPYVVNKDNTSVFLHFKNRDAFFVVFTDGKKNKTSAVIPEGKVIASRALNGVWTVDFGTKIIEMKKPISWTENADSEIKYFSGTAHYIQKFDFQKSNKQLRYILDLGEVKNLVDVILNGKKLRTLWKLPFEMDITDQLVSGENKIELAVTNLWVNRLIGDAQLLNNEKKTFTLLPFYKANDSLLPSGLLGEVKILSKSIKIKQK
ncbi:MAG: hypothetical protein RLZZ540_2988 [Bacteroidota bacterium]|jgi:hypothetical protein